MKTILNWLNDRTGISDALSRWANAPMAGGACWCRTVPAVILFVFCVEVITGFFIWTYYSPSTQTAWESVYYLQYQVQGGWLLRAIHYYAGQTLLALVVLYLLQLILSGRYRSPREAVYWTALLMALFTLALLLTGDLLAWSQSSYASTQVRTKFLLLLPGVGDYLYKIAIGGPEFGHLTLARFLALHIGIFSTGLFLLIVLNHIFIRRANAKLAADADIVSPYWPDQAWRNAVASLLMMTIIVVLALQHGVSGMNKGVPMGSPADMNPANFYAGARPEWAFRGLYEFVHLFPGEKAIIPVFIVPKLIFIFFLLLPFIGRIKIGHYFNVALTVFLLGSVVGLAYHSYAKDWANEEQQMALGAEQVQADRTVELAMAKGIPMTGALTLLHDDPKTQGPIIFKQRCAGCHTYIDRNGVGIKGERIAASNLYGFATRDWLSGLLNPKTIVSSDYFGNTKFRNGDMVNFVKENLSKLDDEEKENLKKVIIALSAEAQLPSQRAIDKQDAEAIKEGQKAITDTFSCTDCHKFHDKGKTGDAPDLTGYGSPQWLTEMISNPKSPRFYGNKNDRMPSFAETNEPAKNILSRDSLGLIRDWLRGEWFDKD